jgi:hypothetical protein
MHSYLPFGLVRKFFISLYFVVAIGLAEAQDYHRIDRLKKSLSAAPNDKNKVKTNMRLGYE